MHADSAYVYIGNLPRDLTEGDVITVMSQYGEVMDVNLPRDKTTGKLRGFGFLMYEDQRSTVLAVNYHQCASGYGSVDMKARVFSAYIKDVEKRRWKRSTLRCASFYAFGFCV